MTVTLKHIAEQAGVSVTTVSRILGGRDTGVPIRDETRQKVLRVASQLGYRPNLLARGLRGSRSSPLGVIVRDISEPFHNQVLRGINDAATKRAYRVFLGHVQRRPDVTIDYASMFEQSHADGMIILGDIEGDEASTAFLTSHHRYVLGISDRVARRAFPGVYADSVLGTRQAMEYLWSLGHRHIACVSDPAIRNGKLRAEVYEQVMREHGTDHDARAFLASRSPQAGYEAG